MSEIAALIENDRSNPARCYFHGQTPLGGSDVCRPELTDDGSILLRSINLNHTVYRVTEDEYRELRKYPQRKVGMWDFVREDDEDADRIAAATRNPQYAGRRIGDLERTLAAKDAEIAKLREEKERLRIDASNHAADAETVRRERDALIREKERLRNALGRCRTAHCGYNLSGSYEEAAGVVSAFYAELSRIDEVVRAALGGGSDA